MVDLNFDYRAKKGLIPGKMSIFRKNPSKERGIFELVAQVPISSMNNAPKEGVKENHLNLDDITFIGVTELAEQRDIRSYAATL